MSDISTFSFISFGVHELSGKTLNKLVQWVYEINDKFVIAIFCLPRAICILGELAKTWKFCNRKLAVKAREKYRKSMSVFL